VLGSSRLRYTISFNSCIYGGGGEKPLVAGCLVLMVGVLKGVNLTPLSIVKDI
jgi:hypothetical protein